MDAELTRGGLRIHAPPTLQEDQAMRRLRLNRIAAAVAVLALAAIGATASAKEPKDFVVHEWGTFSTFAGSDGAYLKFYPNDGDLPDFMHSRHRHVKGGLPDS